jgi:hypothetical protein
MIEAFKLTTQISIWLGSVPYQEEMPACREKDTFSRNNMKVKGV